MSEEHFFSLEGPLDSMPTARQTRAANLAGFGELVRQLGADPRKILQDHDIDPKAILDPDTYIDTQSLVELLEDCSRSFNDSLFGLRLARLQDPDVFGAVTALCRSASTFREGLMAFIDFIPVVHSPTAVIKLVEGQQTSELRWHLQTDVGQNIQAQYKATLLNLKLLRQLGGRSFQPSYIHLAVDSRPKDLPEIVDRFGCPFRKAPVNAIAFPTASLGRPIGSANRLLFRLLGGYLERVRASARVSLVNRVEDYVRGALSTGHCSIEHCAGKIGTSVRTLQANLSESGLRFSEILEQQRIELAKTYLERDDLSLDDLAALLGYAEQSSFGRAFKRWTGATPQRFRRQREQQKPA